MTSKSKSNIISLDIFMKFKKAYEDSKSSDPLLKVGKPNSKMRYYNILIRTDDGNYVPLIMMPADMLIDDIQEYLRKLKF